jgi:hypothetical protein
MIVSRRLRGVFLLLTFLFLAPPLAAVTKEHRSRETRQLRRGIAGLLSEAWAWVGRIWDKEGSSTDPFGNPKPGTAQPFSESGRVQGDSPASGK